MSGNMNSLRDRDHLGHKQKELEGVEAKRAVMAGLPVICRLDGKAFHTYTRGLSRPFDAGLMQCMLDACSAIFSAVHPDLIYTQSDEITVAWTSAGDNLSEFPYGGRYQKLTSILASIATCAFYKSAQQYLPSKAGLYVAFDARVWQVAKPEDLRGNLVWRQDDAFKNAVTMAAQAHFSDHQLHGVHTDAKLNMLRDIGVDFDAFPEQFRRGAFMKRVSYKAALDADTLQRIPEAHRPAGGQEVERSEPRVITVPRLRKLTEDEWTKLLARSLNETELFRHDI